MLPVRELLSGKSRDEQLRWMDENPPAHLRRSEDDGRDRDELCPSCGGLVHDDSEAERPRCRCAGALSRCQQRVDRADPGGRMTFDRIDRLMVEPSLARATALAEKVAAGERRGLAMFGPPGVGKTHVAVAACRAAISRRVTAEYRNVVELVGRVQATYGHGLEDGETRADVIAQVAARDLVVLDDLGKERTSEDVQTIVYELVDAIHRSGARLVVCSNLSGAEYRSRYDEAVTSRIAGVCEIVPVLGEDRRRSR